ncbi:MAG: UDP-N-acetylmuramate dehydrogenase [Lachnospiraceae bacterium]|nr:UDP-N-acetylmuramate dehydrogenase [Lachnospiraceae bacterium]
MLSKTTLDTIRGYVPEENIILDASLSDYTTFKVGGKAVCIVEIETVAQLANMSRYLNLVEYPYFILGNGSNTLALDEGYEGIILHLGKKFSGITVEGNIITAKAGTMLTKISRVAMENGLAGLEFAAGIPGSVGGAVVMNAGAYGGEMSQVVKLVRVVSPEGEIMELTPAFLEFGYRNSVLKHKKFIAAEVVFELQEGNKETIKATMDEYNARRREKQPLEYPSAGSTFKRPEGYFAGKLIMDSGLRGFQIGGARVADKHCGFVVNMGNATAADILDVMAEVKERVFDRFSVSLEPEIVVLK